VNRRVWLLVLVLALSVPLALLLRPVARDVVAQGVLDWVWGVRRSFEGLPQTGLWIGFVALAILLALGSLLRRPRPPPPEPSPTGKPPGPIEVLRERIEHSREIEYARRSLVRRLRALTLEALAHQHRSSVQEMRQRLDRGALDVPPEVQAYLRMEAAEAGRARKLLSRIRRQTWPGARRAAIDPTLEETVRFLESLLGPGAAHTEPSAALGPPPSPEDVYDH
jgi:hypothetical protein